MTSSRALDSSTGLPPDTTEGVSTTGGVVGTDGGTAGANVTPGRPAPTVPAVAQAPRGSKPPSGPRVTDPISLGFVGYASAAGSAGLENGETVEVEKVAKALVAQLNAKGGIAGRPIKPVFATLPGTSNNYGSELQSMCSEMTQDNRVVAVLGTLGFYNEDFEQCLARAGVPHFSGDFVTGDLASFQQLPLMVAAGAMSVDRRVAAQLTVLSERGVLKKGARLGIGLESCAPEQRAYQRTLVPTAKRLGLTIAAKHEFSCLNGVSNASNTASAAAGAVLRFQSADVDTVLYVSYDPSALLFFIKAAGQQGYRPDYLVTSADAPRVLEPNLTADDLSRFKGLGWLPVLDVVATHRTAQADRCLALLARSGLHPKSALDRFNANSVCDSVFLYEAALDATRGASEAGPVVAALGRLSYHGVGVVDGRTSFAGRRDGPAAARVFQYDSRCRCLAYAGGAAPV
jgi:hypothetical protein